MMGPDKKLSSVVAIVKQLQGSDTMENLKNHNEATMEGLEDISGEEVAAKEFLAAVEAKDHRMVVQSLEALVHMIMSKD